MPLLILKASYISYKNIFEYVEIPLLLNGNKNTHTNLFFPCSSMLSENKIKEINWVLCLTSIE